MSKRLNKGYVGNTMSRRAYQAIKAGELPLSMLTKRKLEKAGIEHSLLFIEWLCKNRFIRPTSWHHRGNPPILTRFYHPNDIARQLRYLNIETLLGEWKETWHK